MLWNPTCRRSKIAISGSFIVLILHAALQNWLYFPRFFGVSNAYSGLMTSVIMEAMLVWTLYWSLWGWSQIALRRASAERFRGAFWPAVFPPSLGLGIFVYEYCTRDLRLLTLSPTTGLFYAVLLDPMFPAIFGLLFGVLLYFQCKLWSQKKAPMLSECVSCGYNLTGNVSGKCPECGIQIPNTKREIQRKNFR